MERQGQRYREDESARTGGKGEGWGGVGRVVGSFTAMHSIIMEASGGLES